MRGYGQALDAAGRACQGGEHQQEDQREGELGPARHQVQFSLRGFVAMHANYPSWSLHGRHQHCGIAPQLPVLQPG